MLTWSGLLLFYGANVIVWLGIALVYVYYFQDTDESIVEKSDKLRASEGKDSG